MTRYPNASTIRRALEQTRAALDLPADAALEPMEASVLLKHLLLDGLRVADRRSGKRARRPLLECRLQALVDRHRAEPPSGDALAAALEVLASSPPIYACRLLDLAADAMRGQRMAPEICLSPEPAAATVPFSSHRHAVIFSAPTGFSNEFYPLAVDAFVSHSLRPGEKPIQVLGVHADWFDATCAIRRTIMLDPIRDRLIEADWSSPFLPDSVHFLCLGGRERQVHREFSSRFDCLQINPYAPSALADDKAATLSGWSARGLDIPRSLCLKPGDWERARRFAEAHADSVIKPNRATEGLGVAYVSAADPGSDVVLAEALASCWEHGVSLIQERRDGVLYRDPIRDSLHTLVLRLNLVFDGIRHRLASGFAQIGTSDRCPASCGRNGRILPLSTVLSRLVARSCPRRPIACPDKALWAEISNRAERAAGLFQNLLLVGLDVLLDLDSQGHIAPVFLEANPRPAGLCHSRLLCGPPSPDDPVGIGAALWDGLAAQFPARSARRATSFGGQPMLAEAGTP